MARDGDTIYRAGRWIEVAPYVMPKGWPDVPAEFGAFAVESVRVPAPMQARTVLRSDVESRELVAVLEFRHACPKCFHDTIFAWAESTSREAMDIALRPGTARAMMDTVDGAESDARNWQNAAHRERRHADELEDFVKREIRGRYRPSKERIAKAWRKRRRK